MNILFIVPSYKPAYIYGGPIVVIALLAEQLVKSGHNVVVYTTTANGKAELDVEPGVPQNVDGVQVFYFKRETKDHTHISFSLWKKLSKTIKEFDIVHIHSWWNLLVMGAVWICSRNKVKPILSPHGMLSEYIFKANNSLPKKLIHTYAGRKLLSQTWLHVSTELEWMECKGVIPYWQGKVIPNLVKLPEFAYKRNKGSVLNIGFLSRIDPKKGLDILINALSLTNFNYTLKVAGSGEDSYINELKVLAETCGNADKIEWVGWMNGEKKFDFFSKIDLFALTSHSENFAIVVIEALAVGTPVLISDQVGLFDYVKKNNLGWVTSTDVESVKNKLNEITTATEKLKNINDFAPSLISKHFSPKHLAEQYESFYVSV